MCECTRVPSGTVSVSLKLPANAFLGLFCRCGRSSLTTTAGKVIAISLTKLQLQVLPYRIEQSGVLTLLVVGREPF